MAAWQTTTGSAQGNLHQRPQPSAVSPQEYTAQLQHFRIDDTHSNAYTFWQHMGSRSTPPRSSMLSFKMQVSFNCSPRPNGSSLLMVRLRSLPRCHEKASLCLIYRGNPEPIMNSSERTFGGVELTAAKTWLPQIQSLFCGTTIYRRLAKATGSRKMTDVENHSPHIVI